MRGRGEGNSVRLKEARGRMGKKGNGVRPSDAHSRVGIEGNGVRPNDTLSRVRNQRMGEHSVEQHDHMREATERAAQIRKTGSGARNESNGTAQIQTTGSRARNESNEKYGIEQQDYVRARGATRVHRREPGEANNITRACFDTAVS